MSGPLTGLKILDFSTLLPGPYATMMLADMGADVLRVESPTRIDLARVAPPMDGKVSTTHAFLNRGKRSLALDLKKDEAIAIVKRLVRDYDIVVEQFRPGVMSRLGIGYEELRSINPALIYCAITGYGQTGPYRDRAGHDINYLAIAGVASHSGRKESGPPPLGIQVADVAGGSHHAVMGILAAVIHRQRTGEGQMVDISMTDAAFAMNAMAGAACLAANSEIAREGGMLNGGFFYDYYRAADGGYLSVGSLEPQFMKILCETLDCPQKASLGLSQNPAHQADLKQTLTTLIAEKTLAEWQVIFAPLDACVEPVLSLHEAANHPQLQARHMVIGVRRPDGSEQSQIGFPIKFGRSSCSSTGIGVSVGENTAAALHEAGYSEQDILALRRAGAFGK